MATSKRRVVIDASIARAAGDASMHPISSSCRETLQAILKGNYVVITASALSDEWKKHQSRFFRLWLITMIAKGRFECLSSLPDNEAFRSCIVEFAGNEQCANAMEKDAHLLEIALSSDRRILALDEVVRGLFRSLAEYHHPIKQVMWANPVLPRDSTITWINSGAPLVSSLLLKRLPA